jgi:hypothetical protein
MTISTTVPGGLAELLAAEPAVLTGARIGYARVSTNGQLLDRQLHALNEVGCIKVFADKQSGRDADRSDLVACLAYLRADDPYPALIPDLPSPGHPTPPPPETQYGDRQRATTR